MPLLLNIDTATEVASACITLNGVSQAYAQNENQKEHASFIHAAVTGLTEKTGYKLRDIDGFAVTSGPGSYTGLRVGMATAKGFCYALSKPLITINTLEVMTRAALDTRRKTQENLLFCPMIDARRMEVFTAIYNSVVQEILSPSAVILKEDLFDEYTKNSRILFFGSGSEKYKLMKVGERAEFDTIQHNAKHLGILADAAFNERNFSDVSYSKPTYFKEFHTNTHTP